MTDQYDVLIVGLGAMGSAAAYQLAGRGLRVLGIDRFRPPHIFGSSHGRTRIIREAYFEHPAYVPLVQRAYELWTELEKQSGKRLLLQTGGLMIGRPEGVLVTGARRSAEQHRLQHEILSAAGIRGRFPGFAASDDLTAVWEPRAGILFPELAIETQLELAAARGAQFRFDDPVESWEPRQGHMVVNARSCSYSAKHLVLSPGAWMNYLSPPLNLPLSVERQVLCWFEPLADSAAFRPDRCPIFIWEYGHDQFFYGFPNLGDGLKIGIHHQGQPTEPMLLDRDVKSQETQSARNLLQRFLPQAAGVLKSSAVCMYTNTPDEHFILDRPPGLFASDHRQPMLRPWF
jgi:sarcosine oxidase